MANGLVLTRLKPIFPAHQTALIFPTLQAAVRVRVRVRASAISTLSSAVTNLIYAIPMTSGEVLTRLKNYSPAHNAITIPTLRSAILTSAMSTLSFASLQEPPHLGEVLLLLLLLRPLVVLSVCSLITASASGEILTKLKNLSPVTTSTVV